MFLHCKSHASRYTNIKNTNFFKLLLNLETLKVHVTPLFTFPWNSQNANLLTHYRKRVFDLYNTIYHTVLGANTTHQIQLSGIGEPDSTNMAKNDFYQGFRGSLYFMLANNWEIKMLLLLLNIKEISFFRITQLCRYDS